MNEEQDRIWGEVCARYKNKLNEISLKVREMKEQTDWNDPTIDAAQLEEMTKELYMLAFDVYAETK